MVSFANSTQCQVAGPSYFINMNTRIITWSIVIGILAILAATFLIQRDSPESSKSDFEKLASIKLLDYEGREVALSSYAVKPLVINSWAVWCPFCRNELTDFAKLQEEFQEQIVVIAIDRQEPLEKAKGFTDELGITDDMVFLLDHSDLFYKSLGGFSMPETIFVDRNGKIVFHKRGPMTLEEMRAAVNQHLQ